ncbi:MAG: SDR family oxidoreductase [Planctomycetes bacterium]|nr:SDR family oxidoreductase [Planctomycetota bacterium]
MPTVLITGSNRGLGLEFVRQYSSEGWRVYACCRTPQTASALNALASETVTIHALDVSDFTAIEALAGELQGVAIDVLINNAGVFGDGSPFGSINYEVFRKTLEVNTLAPLRIVECFLPHVEAGELKRIAHVTSKMGSIADNTSGGRYAYRTSKAALNMVNRSLSHDLGARAVTVVLHPGWVATDMGGAGAPLQPPESVTGMRGVIAGLSAGDSGKFYNYDGAELPW